jgi:hypothetical protein
MRAPGRGWLQFEVIPLADDHARLVQTALWDPIGLRGHIYWFSLWPLHQLVFPGLIRGIARESSCPQPHVASGRPRRDDPSGPGET